MKLLLPLLGIAATLTFSSCTSFADPYYASYGGRVSASYSPAYQTSIYRPQHGCYRPQPVYTMGPQYYRVSGVPHGAHVRNYSDAPLIVERRDRNGRPDSIVIPANEY